MMKVVIDPATAMVIAKTATQAITDEETRKRTIILILAPPIGLLLLTALIIYIITSPLSLLLGWILPDEIVVVEAFQKDYGYNQSIGIYDNDYITDSATGVVYYN